ncbi:MAG: DivIVA domain-containing protein [Thermodesulfovibrionales bacterium]|nr:DivIVA domain-containing protein [Thermodesulfovibrionales bacterium]
MKISPYDIQNKQFSTEIFNGFNKDEVLAFMEVIRQQIEELIRENEGLRQQNQAKDQQLIEYRKIDALMRETLLIMQKVSEEYKDNVIAQAEAILKEAEQKAQKRLHQTQQEIDRLKEEIKHLKMIRRHLNEELHRYLMSQISIIENDEEEAQKDDIMIGI